MRQTAVERSSAGQAPYVVPCGAEADEERRRLVAVRRYEILDSPPDGAFDRVAAMAARLLRVPIATVTIVDEDRIWFKARHGLDDVSEIPREVGLCSSAILSGEVYLVSDARTDPRALNNSLVRGPLGLRFYAAAPLVTADGYRLGTVNVIDRQPRQVTEDEVQTLRDLAAMVVDELELRRSALRTVRNERQLRDQAQRVARMLKQTLLPSRLPVIPGCEIATHYRPASADNVGGDFYDVFPVTDGCWGVFIGDVCGKGVEAASLTALARHTLRAAAMVGEDPAVVLSYLDSMIKLERSGRDPVRFCTVAYAHLESLPDGVRLTVANGGHPPVYVFRHGGEIESVEHTGPLIGCIPQARFTTVALNLTPGDAVLFYTDGLDDSRLDGRWLGDERLPTHLVARGPLSATALVGELQTLLDRCDLPQRDDVALLAVSISAPQ